MPQLFEVERDGSVVLSLHVQPGATRTAVVGRHGDALKVTVAAPAEGGRANRAVARLLADSLGLRAAAVELVSGITSAAKRARLHGVDVPCLTRWLEQNLADEIR